MVLAGSERVQPVANRARMSKSIETLGSDQRLLSDIMNLDAVQVSTSLRINETIVKIGSLPAQLIMVPNLECDSTNPNELIEHTQETVKRLEIQPGIDRPDLKGPIRYSYVSS